MSNSKGDRASLLVGLAKGARRNILKLGSVCFIFIVVVALSRRLGPSKSNLYITRPSVNKPFMCEPRQKGNQEAPPDWSTLSVLGENGLIIKPDFRIAPFENPIPPLFADGTPVYEDWFNSQFGEDKLLISRFLCNKRDGVFVELGATDGTWLSNTRIFHEFRNWTGVLIEPYPELFRSLSMSWRCRMGAFCLPMAVCKDFQTVDFWGEQNMAGIAASHTNSKVLNELGREKYRIPCAPMKSILKMTGIRYIDLFSIDVEGAEIQIIESMDWSIPVHIVLMEQESEANNATKRINSIMIEKGFKFYGKIGLNMNVLYVHPDYHRRVAELSP